MNNFTSCIYCSSTTQWTIIVQWAISGMFTYNFLFPNKWLNYHGSTGGLLKTSLIVWELVLLSDLTVGRLVVKLCLVASPSPQIPAIKFVSKTLSKLTGLMWKTTKTRLMCNKEMREQIFKKAKKLLVPSTVHDTHNRIIEASDYCALDGKKI